MISKKTYEEIVGKRIRYDILYKYETAARLIRKYKKDKLKILDIGCGQGIFAFFADKKWTIYGFDTDKDRIRRAKNIKLKNVSFFLADAEKFDFNKKIDVVIALDIIEHLKHPERCFKRIYKNLKDDGIFIVSNPNKYSIWELFLNKWIRLEDHHYLSPKEFSEISKKSGFNLIEVLPRPVFSESIGWLINDYRWFLKFDDNLGRLFPQLATGWFLVFRKD